jgi:hypothetical protein
MSKVKRNWWTPEVRFAKVHRDLRANYDMNLKKAQEKYDDDLRDAQLAYEKKLVAVQMAFTRERDNLAERCAKVASEIARIRLEYGPTQYGGRFQLWVSFEETMIRQIRDIKEYGPLIIEMLCAKIKREFNTIDFARIRPIMPSWSERHDMPRFTLFSDPDKLPEVKP